MSTGAESATSAKARLALAQCAIGAAPLRERDAEQEDQSRFEQHDGEREQEQPERQPPVECHRPHRISRRSRLEHKTFGRWAYAVWPRAPIAPGLAPG